MTILPLKFNFYFFNINLSSIKHRDTPRHKNISLLLPATYGEIERGDSSLFTSALTSKNN